MGRPATPEDHGVICRSLREVELSTSWGDRPTDQVGGTGFVPVRAPHPTAVDPVTGGPYDDLLVSSTPTPAEEEALVADESLRSSTVDHVARHLGRQPGQRPGRG